MRYHVVLPESFFLLFGKHTSHRGSYTSAHIRGSVKITEPNLITFESSKIDIYLDDILLRIMIYVIYLIT